MPARADAPTVAVVGGGLAGLAAAARLAKRGRAVTLHEAAPVLGGRWAPAALPGTGAAVDATPVALGFPAPWRDLFRKCGRPLEAELARAGYALVPAPPARLVFADGDDLVLPAERGGQHAVLTRAYGPAVAARWRDLLDGLDGVWQALRPLGVEAAYDRGALTRETRRRLWSRRSVADLAERAGHPHLRALVRSVAHRQGSRPERTPALAAVDLALARTFGRWQVEPAPGAPGDPGRTGLLVELLAARLGLRGVDVRLAAPVSGVAPGPDGWTVTGPAGAAAYGQVVLAVDPWTAGRLVPALGRDARRLSPAAAPTVRRTVVERPTAPVEEVVLDADGVPVVRERRPIGGVGVLTVHDHTQTAADPAYGVAAAGFRGWARWPGTATDRPGLVRAGSGSPAGAGPSAVLQTGALACYALDGPDR